MNIFKTCFNALRHPFSVEGGITRGEYFVILAMSVFLMVLSYMGIDAIAYNIMMGDMDTLIIGTLVIISDLIILFLAIPMITSTVRRLHDVGVPGKILVTLIMAAIAPVAIYSLDWNDANHGIMEVGYTVSILFGIIITVYILLLLISRGERSGLSIK